MTLVLGLDGCRAGWCGVPLALRDGAAHLLPTVIFPSFADALATDARVIAIDVPIGLLDVPGGRSCDHEARRLLGRPAASSVFPPPSRKACGVADYWEASAVNVQLTGRRLTRQSHNIAPKICEVDRLMKPALQTRVYEVHPELCFWALNGRNPLAHRKKRRAGRDERWSLLRPVLSDLPEEPPLPRHMPDSCAVDDYLDALAAAWAALAILEARARRVPLNPEPDATSLRMEIWFPAAEP